MTTYEYKIEGISTLDNPSAWTEREVKFNEFGAQGWNLVNIISQLIGVSGISNDRIKKDDLRYSYYAIFKREIK